MTRRGATWLAPAAVARHRAAWDDLATRALEPSIFNDPDFALPAALWLARGRQPRFLLAWDDATPDRLIGLCCVVAPAPGLPLAGWLHPQATAAFPLLDAAQPGVALAKLLAQTATALRPAGLLMLGVPAAGATLGCVSAQPHWCVETLDRRSRATVGADPPSLPGKAGKEFRRQARRLAGLGHVAVTVGDTSAAIEAFLALEARGWKGRRRTALLQTPALARFVRTTAGALAAAGRCRVVSLTLDERPIAMGVVLRSGPHAFFWKTAFDEAFGRFSPGAHLTEIIGGLQARNPDVVLTDSCAIPGHSMIDRLWPGRMHVADVFVAPVPKLSRAQTLALRVEAARRAARAWVKRRLGTLRHRSHNPDMAKP